MIMEFFTGILFVLKILCVLASLCTVCLCIDTYINVVSYLRDKRQHVDDALDHDELANVEPYDNVFFEDGK